MDRRTFLGTAGSIGLFTLQSQGQERRVCDLSEQLENLRQEHGLPGIAAAAVRGSDRVAEGVAGVREIGEPDKIARDDRFGMASCTKVMTSTMVLRLIDKEVLSFGTTLAEALPGFSMRDEYRPVTVAQLLLFNGGIQPYMQFVNQQGRPLLQDFQGTARERREQFVRNVLQEEPVVKPGTERRYSNASYAIAGLVADRRTGKSWETLMREEVFEPLKMTTADFGRPRNKQRPNEPALHELRDGRYVPEADDHYSGSEVMAPAGNVCCSIRDFAKFAAYELNAGQGMDALLKPATRERWQALSQSAGPLVYDPKVAKKSKGPKAVGPKVAGPKGPDGQPRRIVGGPGARDGRSFSGGSNFISCGCILWPSINLAIVAAINAGGAGGAVREAFDAIKQREQELGK